MTRTQFGSSTDRIKSAATRCASVNTARVAGIVSERLHNRSWRVLLRACGGDSKRALAEYVSAMRKTGKQA